MLKPQLATTGLCLLDRVFVRVVESREDELHVAITSLNNKRYGTLEQETRESGLRGS